MPKARETHMAALGPLLQGLKQKLLCKSACVSVLLLAVTHAYVLQGSTRARARRVRSFDHDAANHLSTSNQQGTAEHCRANNRPSYRHAVVLIPKKTLVLVVQPHGARRTQAPITVVSVARAYHAR